MRNRKLLIVAFSMEIFKELTIPNHEDNNEVDNNETKPRTICFVGAHSIVHHGIPIFSSQHLQTGNQITEQ